MLFSRAKSGTAAFPGSRVQSLQPAAAYMHTLVLSSLLLCRL